MLVILAILTIAVAIVLALNYISKHIPSTIGYYIAIGFVLSFAIEIGLRLINKRTVSKQTDK